MSGPAPSEIRALVRRALDEDRATQDLTSDVLQIRAGRVEARIVARAAGIWCGGEIALEVFRSLGVVPKVLACARDGTNLKPGDLPLRVEGPAGPLLAAERTALNFLQRLCGIATRTAAYVRAVDSTGARISDTRKTLPGWRALDKHAVRTGGGENHRGSLADNVLVKRNHLRVAGLAPADAARRLQAVLGHAADCEIEVATPEEAFAVARIGVRWILLDNFTPEVARDTIRALHAQFPAVLVEVSGGITLDNVRTYAEGKPDRISVGALTHSAPALDLAMEFVSPA